MKIEDSSRGGQQNRLRRHPLTVCGADDKPVITSNSRAQDGPWNWGSPRANLRVRNERLRSLHRGWMKTPTPKDPKVPTTTVEVSELAAKDRLVQAIAIRSVSDLSA
jgi:hypothetical protein